MRWTEEELATYQARQRGEAMLLPRPVLPLEAVGSESMFQAAVVAAAQALGWHVYHTYRSTRSPAGFPDLILAKPGMRLLCIELKTNTGRLSLDQEDWLTVLGQTQQPHAEVWRPADWQTILDRLQY